MRALQRAIRRSFAVPDGCAWVNYIRCHDDIGWAFSDEDIVAAGFHPPDHRRFLAQFYTGRHAESFARGAPFQENPRTGDARISGTCASLAGLEKALAEDDAEEADLAVRRILLLHGVLITMGGIPLFYLGDEIGMLNDYAYDQDPEKMGDSRWLHRAAFDWERAEERRDPSTAVGKIYNGLLRLIQLRGQNPTFSHAETEIADTGNKHVFGYFRTHNGSSLFVLANLSEKPQSVDARKLRLLGLRKTMVDLVRGRAITATQELEVEPYQLMVLTRPA